ncbi:S9 family peptidase [Kineosporia sp. J2-2]|uniref:S9 family peptidase n=1 Tax=Kineosporia corallincola TaxID=2835133 RepID=A0ABS5T913_9ACTN|nr:prolyl oligopeptidase family serine peptidase [Kineosporia corallincola]MBT0767318.1 S9 family peptidase [Kineosporia corallincola]
MTAPTPSQPSPLPAWERRFRAGRIGMPVWATGAPDRCSVVATHDGVLEMHSWRVGEPLALLTSRREGTAHGEIDPSGEWIWWFDDAAGNEHGIWRKQPFGSPPGSDQVAIPVLLPSYSAGLALGPDGLAVIGQNDDGYGTRIHVEEPGKPLRLIYEHIEDAGVGGLSEDGSLLAIAHSEHGDSRHTALRVLRVDDGSTVADLWDGAGKSLEPLGFAPVVGDPRLLVLHERRGRGELLIWDVVSGTETAVNLDVPGEISEAQWYRDASALLVSVDHEARTRLYTISLISLATEAVGPTAGTVMEATTRPGGAVWTLWSSAELPPAVRDLDGAVVLAPPGEPAPPSVVLEDVWVDGPGGRVHALLRRPAGVPEPLPLVIDVHGGPTAHDGDWFRAYPSAWVDHGFAVLQVNYRGSTGYGSLWRDALEKRVGHIELEDVVAVRDHLVDAGTVAPGRIVLAGASWGGYLTLLGLGLYPDRWAVGVAGVPVADYLAAYEDEMEGLKAFDRSLFGGSPDEVPGKYQDSSPITYVGEVSAPVMILAGENDPRCPIRQIENYVKALSARGSVHEVYRYDAGHGSLVDDERVRQVRAEIDFVQRHLPT